ncbi:MAG TPA: hypothetical protein VFA16_10315 [Mycobacterium sp.]|uniref:hypothetical protein n=1 Tax=Mycobacterium sp. TaxID=1785 RepID=UPI002D2D7A7F|nr:hypothetical protein [Mycobacterium sp.]HZU47624.1 hypothetical protein [Mycobacterium sp.]
MIRRYLLRSAVSITTIALALLGACDAAAAAPVPVGAGGWTMTPVARAASSADVPPIAPIVCRGVLVSVYGSGTVQTLEVDGSAACSDQVDELDFTWTWFDATTNQVIWSSGTHAVTNTATVFTTSSSSAGTFGNRNIELCLTSYKAGYNPNGSCIEVFNS